MENNDLLDQLQCDEAPYIPSEDDWAEYELWLDSHEIFFPDESTFVIVGKDFRPENNEDCPF